MFDSIRVLESLLKDEFPNTDNLKANLVANRILDVLELVKRENAKEQEEENAKRNRQ